MTTFYTINAIKQFHTSTGLHFFDKSAMRLFNSRILETVYYGNIFVTSESYCTTSPRKYTVRRMLDSGNISNISEFQEFTTAQAAKKFAREVSKEISNS